MKTKIKRTKTGRFTSTAIRVRKFMLSLLILTIAFVGYWGYMIQWPEYVSAEVNVKKDVIIDNRTVQEHVFDIMREEFDVTFKDIIKAMAMIERCENPDWKKYAHNPNGPTNGCPRGSVDWGIWQLNDCYQLEYFDDKDALVECAIDVYCSTRHAMKLYKQDGDFRQWSCNL